MIRIVEVLEATTGGTRRHLWELVSTLSEKDFDVRVVCSIGRDVSFQEDVVAFRERGIRVHILPMARAPHPLLDPVACMRLRRLLRREPCDILHLHSAKAGLIGRIASLGLKCRVLYTPHCFPFQRNDPQPLPMLYWLGEKVLAKRTHGLLAVGAAEGDLALRNGLYGRKQVHVLPNAVDARALRDRVRKPQTELAACRVKVIGLISELRNQKDPKTLVRAVKLLQERGLDIDCVLPARGSALKEVRALVRELGLKDRFTFEPAEASLASLYRQIDLGVLPSLWEGLPYALLEALALEIPVVGSSIGPIRETLGALDEDLLFRPGNAEDLANRIEEWTTWTPERRRLIGVRGRRLVRRDHDRESWSRRVRELYRSMV